MEIILTYEGMVKSSKDVHSIWRMRRSFSKQLEKFWNSEHFGPFREHTDALTYGDGTHFVRTVGQKRFISLFGRPQKVGVRLEILLLSGIPTVGVDPDQRGDLDNRIKRVVDALRAIPNGAKHEIPRDDMNNSETIYSLIDDDNAVVSINGETGPLLSSDNRKDNFVLIKIRPYAFRVTMDNIGIVS